MPSPDDPIVQGWIPFGHSGANLMCVVADKNGLTLRDVGQKDTPSFMGFKDNAKTVVVAL